MDATWPKKAADSFWLAAARNLEQRRLNPAQFQMLLIPGVVCLAFSIELGIKAILLRTGNPPRTHNLRDLFALLPGNVQDDIVRSCGRPPDAFQASLSSAANIFVEWRYVYDMEQPQVDLPFLNALADAVKTATDAPAA
jgi:hypothetical protein